ncbi:nucleoside 2-deoxyribosyltransferase [Bacillus mexicanus]|uniref:nucleoside 2-deoxyribosyltransferase n=1 Tax=Bacillus mexicanus TaxID=2834415 RepID=UPI003D23D4AE
MNLEGKRIYLASGWFNETQEKRLSIAEKVLREMGFDVFSPREHQFSEYIYNTQPWRDVVFKNDVDNVKSADLVFAIYDETDSGTMFEIGLAYAIGKPIFIFHEKEEYCNLMISESLIAYFKTWEEVKSYNWKTCPLIRFEGQVE